MAWGSGGGFLSGACLTVRPPRDAPAMADPLARLELDRNEVDRVFGAGYGAEHPELTSAVMLSAALGLGRGDDCRRASRRDPER